MKKFSYDYFGAETTGWHIGSIPNTKMIVKDCTLCNPRDILYIKYIIRGEDPKYKAVNVMCFDFQYECIRKYLGDSDNVSYYTYNSEKAFETEDSR